MRHTQYPEPTPGAPLEVLHINNSGVYLRH